MKISGVRENGLVKEIQSNTAYLKHDDEVATPEFEI